MELTITLQQSIVTTQDGAKVANINHWFWQDRLLACMEDGTQVRVDDVPGYGFDGMIVTPQQYGIKVGESLYYVKNDQLDEHQGSKPPYESVGWRLYVPKYSCYPGDYGVYINHYSTFAEALMAIMENKAPVLVPA